MNDLKLAVMLLCVAVTMESFKSETEHVLGGMVAFGTLFWMVFRKH